MHSQLKLDLQRQIEIRASNEGQPTKGTGTSQLWASLSYLIVPFESHPVGG